MRNLSVAKKELRLMKAVLEEFVRDYDYAQSEEDLSTTVHQEFAKKIGDVYTKCKDIEHRLSPFV